MRTDLFSALIILLNVITACNNSSNTTAIKAPTKHDKVAAIPTAQPASPTSDCDNALWKYVYDPDRLQVLEKCKTVTGVIEESNADPDGDQHMLLKLDKGQKDLINKKNKKKKERGYDMRAGCLVLLEVLAGAGGRLGDRHEAHIV